MSLIYDTCVVPKPAARGGYCEDLTGWLGDTFWLLDGASAHQLRHKAIPNQPTGAAVVREVDMAFRQALYADKDISLRSMIELAESRLALLRPEGVLQKSWQICAPQATLILGRIRDGLLTYAIIQDSDLVVSTNNCAPLLRDTRQNIFNAEFYREIESRLSEADTEGYQRLLSDMVHRERCQRNIPVSPAQPAEFVTLTGFGDVASLAVYGDMPIKPGDQVLLASDGAARAWTLFGIPFSDAIHADLMDLALHVRGKEYDDLSSQQTPRIGVHDDIAYLRVRLSSKDQTTWTAPKKAPKTPLWPRDYAALLADPQN